MSRIKVRVQGTQVNNIRIEGDSKNGFNLQVLDPKEGRYPVGGLKLEILPEFGSWVEVTEHELLALLMAPA